MSGGHEVARGIHSEKLHDRWNSLLFGDFRDVGRRLDSERRNASLHEELEQIAIIAGNLHHAFLRSQSQPLDHLLDVVSCVPKPGVREGREVGVVREDVLSRYILLELDQEAALANPHPKGIERLHLVELVTAQEALAKRRHSQINDCMAKPGSAKTAMTRCRAHCHWLWPRTRVLHNVHSGHLKLSSPTLKEFQIQRLATCSKR